MKIKHILKKNPVIYRLLMNLVEKYNNIRWKIVASDPRKIERLIASEYKKNTGGKMRVPPISYTEKMQFSKVYYATAEKGLLSDKYAVREWVKLKIGDQYLIPLLGVWDKFEDIDFANLPNQFVLKTNQSSGTNTIVTDKESLDLRELKRKYKFWVKQNWAFAGCGFEMHYQYIKPKIIAEKYVVDPNGDLNDYKFLCFNGKPYYVWVDEGRRTDHRRNVYDMNWDLQPWRQYRYKNTEQPIQRPEKFGQMVKLVEVLCQGFDHVRVDLYYVNGTIYFGEMTFTNGKGYELIYPPEYNDALGKLWNLKM